MKVTRIYTGPDNQSHFEDVEIPLKDGSVVGRLSELIPATGVIFRETGGDYDLDFHNAPRRQYVVMLEGRSRSRLATARSASWARERFCWPKIPPVRDISAGRSTASPESRCLFPWPKQQSPAVPFFPDYVGR